jgi:ribosomal protein S18 acetylase RimI-like enzyme
VPVGYSYFIHEANKALLGELFVSAAYRSDPTERHLLTKTLRAAAVFPGVSRIEGQLLALGFDPAGDSIYGRKLAVYPRNFMLTDGLETASSPTESGAGFEFREWTDQHLEPAVELIRRAYEGHVDSLINDQYRTSTGVRRFLYNSTQHPGCGVFLRHGARAVFDGLTGELAGVCLGSLVHSDVAHVTQLCVSPTHRGRGLARQLLSQAAQEYRRHGCNGASLTVTASNEAAIRLYESMGFRTVRQFPAIVWEAY